MLVCPPRSQTWNLMFLYVTVSTLNPIAASKMAHPQIEYRCYFLLLAMYFVHKDTRHSFGNDARPGPGELGKHGGLRQLLQEVQRVSFTGLLGMVETTSPTCNRSAGITHQIVALCI